MGPVEDNEDTPQRGESDFNHDKQSQNNLRRRSKTEAVELFDKVFFDTTRIGNRRVTGVGGDCAFRTTSTLFNDKNGLFVVAETRYIIDVDTWTVNVDENTLYKVIDAYAAGGVDAAEEVLAKYYLGTISECSESDDW